MPDDIFKQELLNALDALYRTARYMIGDPQQAEDIVHDVVAKALEARHTFRRGAEMRPWLFAILRNTVADYYRRRGRQFERVAIDDLEYDAIEAVLSLDDQVLANVMDETIEKALAQLPEEMRLAVLLADVEGLSYREIAEALSWPPGTVMSRLHRGRKKLRQRLLQSSQIQAYLS